MLRSLVGSEMCIRDRMLTLADDSNRGKVVTTYNMVFAIGFAIGPAVIGLTGLEGSIPFITIALISFIVIIPILTLKVEAPDLSDHKPIPVLLAVIAAPTIFGAAILMGLEDVMFVSFFPIYLIKSGFGYETALNYVTISLAGGVLAQPLIGLGLIESIYIEDIMKNEDEFDLDNDGISGRANIVWDDINQKEELGRFGWKASQPSIYQQVADALFNDMGLSNPLYTNPSNCGEFQIDCLNAINGNSIEHDNLEVSNQQLELITFYSQQLGVPARRDIDDEDVIAGQGTVGIEMLNDFPEVDTVIIPTSGGGLIGGIAIAIKHHKPNVKIIAMIYRNNPNIVR